MQHGDYEAPAHLAEGTRLWWLRTAAAFELDPAGCKLLTLACESWERGREARAALDRHGLTFDDRFGQPRARPEVAVERDCRIGFARMLRELKVRVPEPTKPDLIDVGAQLEALDDLGDGE